MQTSEWSAERVRMLRLRLGWSQAELARQLSCHVDLVKSWESEDSNLDAEVTDQLERWSFAADNRSDKTQAHPQRERDLIDQGIEQLFDTD